MKQLTLTPRTDGRSGAAQPFVLSYTPTVNRGASSKLIAIIFMILAFAFGFIASYLLRSRVQPAESKPPVSDFAISLPQGQTVITVSDPEKGNVEVARLLVNREGDTISGLLTAQKILPARAQLSADDVAFFRRELTGVISGHESSWQKANQIRSWLAAMARHISMPGLSTRVPRQAYTEMREGKGVLCGNLSEIYVALCQAAGLIARPVGLSAQVRNGNFGIDTHAAVEVWIPDMGGWIYEDPTFDCYWKVDGKPASALVIHEALMSEKPLEFGPRIPSTIGRLAANYIDPRVYFRHISYEYNAGGPLLYYVEKKLEPLNLAQNNWIQTSNPGDISRLDLEGNTVEVHGGEISPGIFAQLIGSDLFIRDRREGTHGIRVRSSTGTVVGCAYTHERAEALGMFRNSNLANNPLFRDIGEGGQLANGWSVAGPVEVMTMAGGQALAAQAGGKLWQRIPVHAHGNYLMYARVSVSRGIVNWSLQDSARGSESFGTLQPERISEVVSDVVETQSGYLDIGFEVPAEGSFRVIDVIVTEAPRFRDDSILKGLCLKSRLEC